MIAGKNEFINEWIGKIDTAEKARKKYSSQTKWKKYRQWYRNDFEPGIRPVNRIFSLGRSLIPDVYFRMPRVTVTPLHPKFAYAARVLEVVDNLLMQTTELKSTLKTAALTSYLNGIAPIKLGYDSEFGYTPAQATDEDSATVTQHSRKENRKIEYHSNIMPGMPWALPELPENVLIPPGYKSPHNLPWIGHMITRPVEDVKQDQKYRNTENLQGTTTYNLSGGSAMQRVFDFFKDSVAQYTTLYEIRDFSTGEIYVFCEGEQLLGDKDALQFDGDSLPWEFLVFNEDPEHFWGISDAGLLESQQQELNEINTQGSKHRRIALLKFLYKKGSITQASMDSFLSGQVGPAIEIDSEGSPANDILTLQPHVPIEFQRESLHVRDNMRETLGRSENQAGAFSPYHNKTATETMEVAAGGDSRDGERKDMIADVLTNIVRKWNQMIFSFWDSERLLEVSGLDGQPEWIRYTGDMLKGDYMLRIDAESGMPISTALRMQAADKLMGTYGGDELVNQVQLKHMHLRQFEWVFPGISNILNQQVDPMTGQVLSAQRQPGPMGKGAGGKAGRQAGNVSDFAEAKKRFEESGGKK